MKLGEEIPHLSKEQIEKVLEEAFYGAWEKAQKNSRKVKLYVYGEAGMEAFDKALKEQIFTDKSKTNE